MPVHEMGDQSWQELPAYKEMVPLDKEDASFAKVFSWECQAKS